MSNRRLALSILAPAVAVSAFLLPLATTRADVIRLRTGESVKGRPLIERSDEDVLVVEDYLSGAVRRLQWGVVDAEDRNRLHEEWGWKNKDMQPVPGHRVVQRLQGGATEDVRGLIVKEDATHVHLMRGGKVVPIPKAQVDETIEEEMDPRDIWTAEQLVERFLEELRKEDVDPSNPDSRASWRIAEFAELAGDFETARKHYAACAADPEFLRSTIAQQRLEKVEEVLRDAAAIAALRDIRMAVSLKSFRRVRQLLESFPAEHPESGDEVKRRLEKVKKDFLQSRAEFFQLEAKINFPKLVLSEIKDKVGEKDIGLSDVTSWTRRELPDRAFDALATDMNRRDDVTPEEARGFWDARKKSGWRTATYGAGTFIVDPPKIKPPKRKNNNNNDNRGGGRGGGASAPVEIPKPPTRDGWWAGAHPKDRIQWVMAFFAQNSGLFEVSDTFKYSVCTICNGTGLGSKSLSNGESMAYLCTRCGGAQRDKRIQYR